MKSVGAPVVSLATVSAAATRAVQWIAKSWPPRDPDTPSLALEALALVHLCRVVGASECRAGAALENEIARSFPDPPWAAGDLSASLLAAAGALSRVPAIASSAKIYLKALRELEEQGCLDGSGGALIRLALHGGPPPIGPGPAAKLELALPPCARGQLLASLSNIETASAFGCVPVIVQPQAAILLEGAAMAAFRAYDLPLGMRILRARRYLDDDVSAGLVTGLDFLGLLQCDDGSFGDFDAALRRIAASGHRDGGLRVKLPITLHAIWSMAELEDPGFRLARHAFTLSASRAFGETSDAVQRAN